MQSGPINGFSLEGVVGAREEGRKGQIRNESERQEKTLTVLSPTPPLPLLFSLPSPPLPRFCNAG